MDNYEVIGQSFAIDEGAYLDEATFLNALRIKVAYMLGHEIDLLLSTLYRLDVIEDKIQAVFANPAIPNDLGLATLILDRQKERIETRSKYKSTDDVGEDWAF